MGQQTLFQRCYSKQGIHDFSAGFCAAGPNAFVQCDSEESLGFSGSIDSWACGLLFDVVNIDVIIGIDGKRVKNFAELQEGLAKHRPGDKVTVKVLRDKKEKDIEMTLKNAQGTTKVVKSAGMDILGAAFREVPQELKRQLNLGYGVEVTGVTDGKMKAAGIRKGFIILKANGQPVKSVNDLEDVLKAATQSPDQVLFLSGMFPSGKRANYAVDLIQE